MTIQNFKWSNVNWMQAGVEASLLLIGVLLALAGQAWWENKKEHEAYIEAGRSLVGSMQSQQDGKFAPSLEKHFSKPNWVSDFRPATSALKNLVGAGGLGLLQSTELQLAISKYAQSIDDHNVLQVENIGYFFQIYLPFITQRVSLLDIGYSSKILELPGKIRFSTDLKSLFDSMVFENLVVTRMQNELDAKHYAERFQKASVELLGILQEMGL